MFNIWKKFILKNYSNLKNIQIFKMLNKNVQIFKYLKIVQNLKCPDWKEKIKRRKQKTEKQKIEK
jgi:hypothetical protein